MEPKQLTRLSKFLSLVLRHKPSEIGITLEPGGWALVSELVQNMKGMTTEVLQQIVDEDEKRRYQYNDAGTMVRAVQGHSIDVDLGLAPLIPPDVLYHGTAGRFLISINAQGLRRMNRQFVHLSEDAETARVVGARHGKPFVLQVDAKKMHDDGKAFYRAENGVWLIDYVPPEYFTILVEPDLTPPSA